jgi:hypothetical protein
VASANRIEAMGAYDPLKISRLAEMDIGGLDMKTEDTADWQR